MMLHMESIKPIYKLNFRQHCKRTIMVVRQGVDAAAIARDRNRKKLIAKNCPLFTNPKCGRS